MPIISMRRPPAPGFQSRAGKWPTAMQRVLPVAARARTHTVRHQAVVGCGYRAMAGRAAQRRTAVVELSRGGPRVAKDLFSTFETALSRPIADHRSSSFLARKLSLNRGHEMTFLTFIPAESLP